MIFVRQQSSSIQWHIHLSKWFMTFSPVLLQEQPAVVLLLEEALVSWSLAIDERGGHEDLYGLSSQSVIPYVYRRTEFYCSTLSCICDPEPYLFLAYLLTARPPTPVKWHLSELFIAQGRTVTMNPEARQVASG
jgi:hypothetical protein